MLKSILSTIVDCDNDKHRAAHLEELQAAIFMQVRSACSLDNTKQQTASRAFGLVTAHNLEQPWDQVERHHEQMLVRGLVLVDTSFAIFVASDSFRAGIQTYLVAVLDSRIVQLHLNFAQASDIYPGWRCCRWHCAVTCPTSHI